MDLEPRGLGAAVGLFPGSCQRGGACNCALTPMAPTPCNSNSMWKCPLVPVGLLLSGVEAGTCRGRGATATQHARRNSMAVHGPGKAKSGGLSAGCQDGVHRALTYELTASTLISPLAANSIGHRYVRLNASHNDTKERGRSGGTSKARLLLPALQGAHGCQVLPRLLVATCYVD